MSPPGHPDTVGVREPLYRESKGKGGVLLCTEMTVLGAGNLMCAEGDVESAPHTACF